MLLGLWPNFGFGGGGWSKYPPKVCLVPGQPWAPAFDSERFQATDKVAPLTSRAAVGSDGERGRGKGAKGDGVSQCSGMGTCESLRRTVAGGGHT